MKQNHFKEFYSFSVLFYHGTTSEINKIILNNINFDMEPRLK